MAGKRSPRRPNRSKPPRKRPAGGNPPPTAVTSARESRRRRLLRRLLGIGYAASIVLAVGIGISLHYRTELVTTVVKAAAAPFDVEIARIDFEGLGGAVASDVVLRIPGSAQPVARIERLRVAGSIRRAVAGELAALEIDHADVRLDDAFFNAVSPGRGDPIDTAGAGHPAAGPGEPKLAVQDLRIRDATVTIERKDLPRVGFHLQYEANDLKVGGSTGQWPLESGGQRVRITGLRATAPETSAEPGAVLAESRLLEAVVASISREQLHIARLAIEGPRLSIQPAFVDAVAALLPQDAAAPKDDSPSSSPSPTAIDPPSALPGLRIDEIVVIDGSARASGLESAPARAASLQMKFPDSSLRIEATGRALAWNPIDGLVSGSATLDLTDVGIGDIATAPSISLDAAFVPGRITLEDIALRSPTLTWRPSASAAFAFARNLAPAPGSESADPADGEAARAPARAAPLLALRRLRLTDARLDAHDIGPLQRVRAVVDGELRELEWNPETGGIPSGPELQQIGVTDLAIEVAGDSADEPHAGVPAFRAGEVMVDLRPDDWRTSGRIRMLSVKGLESRLSRADLLTLAGAAGPGGGAPMAPPEDAARNQPRHANSTPDPHPPGGIMIEELSLEEAPFVVEATPELGIPAATGTAAIQTRSTPDGPRWLASLADLHLAPALAAPPAAEAASPSRTLNPFATFREIRAAINPATFLSTRSIEDVTFAGAHVIVGRDLTEWSESASPAPDNATNGGTERTEQGGEESGADDKATEAPTGAGAATAGGWTVDRVTFDQSIATLQDVVPGLPPVTFALDTTLEAVPLSRDGLLASRRPQRVEISNASIRSQLEPLYSVADLRSIFLDFTLAGLLERRVDRIEIVSPVLYVGEHLFWYIDFYRKFEAAGEDGNADVGRTAAADATTSPSPLFADIGTAALAFAAATSPLAGPPDLREQTGWTIDVIEAHNGRMVLAPKGIPIPSLPELPFSGRTRLVNSQLAFTVDAEELEPAGETPLLQLTIPEGDYPIRAFNLDWNLDLLGLSGDIAFNLPIESRNNNLVQTLRAAQVWFEQVGGKDVFLSVTYDQFGVYAQFGGETFGGYANGEFNLYLDEKYSWDGWVTGTNIALRPLTESLTPEYCSMTGTADLQLIANGDLASLESLRADGFFTTREGGGTIDVLALADLDEALPEDLEAIPRALAEAGLHTLQHFTYDTARIDFEALGREGRLNLELRGPSGARIVDITVHDERYLEPPP